MWDRAVSTGVLCCDFYDGDYIFPAIDGFMIIFCRDRTYKPSLKDVGTYLALYWVPTRADNKCGEPLVAICSNPVSPGITVVLN